MTTTPLGRTFLFVCMLFSVLWAGLLYWNSLRPGLLMHPLNPRRYQVFYADRGRILARDQGILAHSVPSTQGYRREYQGPASLSHIVGYFHPRFGMHGLESVFDATLRSGGDVVLTIDQMLQERVEQALVGRVGSVVAINPTNGQVLAMVSQPALDSNRLEANWSAYRSDPDSPFVNRALSGLYPPGSVVKPIVLAAAVEQGIVSAATRWHDLGIQEFDGQRIRNFGGEALGVVGYNEALAFSSNVVFSEMAAMLTNTLTDYYSRLGLGQAPSRIELPTRAGRLPDDHRSAFGWAQLGIGQADLLVTPLQMALVAAVFANRGVFVEPYLVLEAGRWWWLGRRFPTARQVILPNTAGDVVNAMVMAVNKGTAAAASLPMVQVAGKTGTAQNPSGEDHAWFIGFAPANSPQVALAIVIEHGGTGGVGAAPIAAEVIRAALESMEER